MDKYETLGSRILAFILDGVFIIFASVAVLLFAAGIGGWAAKNVTNLFAVFSLGYYVLPHYFFGQTLGKKLAKVKVVDTSEKPVSFGQSMARSLPHLILVMFSISFSTGNELALQHREMFYTLIFGMFIFSLVDIGFFLATVKRRALHDFFAGTVVVRSDI